MESLSYWLFWAGLLWAATACVAFGFNAAVSPRSLGDTGPGYRVFGRTGPLSLLAAFCALSLALAARTVVAKAPPMADMWGYFVMMGAALSGVLALTSARWKEPSLSLAGSLVIVAGLVAAFLAFEPDVRPLIPALQANRILTIHVTTMVLSYAFISVAFIGASLYLVATHTGSSRLVPRPQKAYDVAQWAATAALPLHTLGIALGAWWANDAWGRYWAWDPKETMSLVTWLTLVAYFHMQGLRRFRGKRAAWVLVLAFGTIVFNMVGVNFWITGLHSYA